MYAGYQEDIEILNRHDLIFLYKKKKNRQQLLEYAVLTFTLLGEKLPNEPCNRHIDCFARVLGRSNVFTAMVKQRGWVSASSQNPIYISLTLIFSRYMLFTEWSYLVKQIRSTP